MEKEEVIFETILSKVMMDSLSIDTLILWIKNTKSTVYSCGVLQLNDSEGWNEEISRYRFILWFLNRIRMKASQITAERRPRIVTSSVNNSDNRIIPEMELHGMSSANSFSSECETITSNQDEKYLQDFPGLGEGSSKKCSKSVKRINPTSVKNESKELDKGIIEANCGSEAGIISPLNVRNEALLKRRFHSKRSKFKKPHYSLLPINISYSRKTDLFASNCDSKKLEKVIDLYNCLLKNYLVPSIGYEIRFILNIFDIITDRDIFCSFCDKHCSEDCLSSVLCSEVAWRYFCTSLICKQEFLISKLECNILKFIVNRMSLLKVDMPGSYTSISKDVIFAQPGCTFHNRLFNKISISDFTDKDEFNCFSDLKAKFEEVEKNWQSHLCETSLIEDIKSVLNLASHTSHFYFIGKYFVCYLIEAVEDRNNNGPNHKKKMAQLNTRLTKPNQDDECGIIFHCSELFFKIWLDFCLSHCPIMLYYIKVWILHAIFFFKNENNQDIGDSRSTLLWILKIKLTLAKFLGYVEFYFSRDNHLLPDIEQRQLISLNSEVLPPFDLKSCLKDAIKNGTLVLTIPWIVEFLCMADHLSCFFPKYRDILFACISLYLSPHTRCNKDGQKEHKKGGPKEYKKEILIKTSCSLVETSTNIYDCDDSEIEVNTILLSESSLLFLLLWIGRLFENKIFGESMFLELAHSYKEKSPVYRSAPIHRKNVSYIDCTDFAKRDLYLFCCSHFSKMKYWQKSSPSYIRNIRPITLDSGRNQSPVDIQEELESNFLCNHQGLEPLIIFISGRISTLCQQQLSTLLAPVKVPDELELEKRRCTHSSEGLQVDKKLCRRNTLLVLKNDIVQVIKECESKIEGSLRCLAPHDIASSVLETCFTLTCKKFRIHIKDWLINEGFCLDEIKQCFTVAQISKEDQILDDIMSIFIGGGDKCHFTSNASISSAFLEIQKKMQEIIKGKIFESFDTVIEEFQQLGKRLQEVNDKRLFLDLYVVSWDFVLLLATNHPEELSTHFLRKMVSFWLQNHYGNNEERILCPRTIKAGSLKDLNSQGVIALNLANLISCILEEKMLNLQNVETQCIAMLRHTWTKYELEFIKLCLIALLKTKSTVCNPELVNVVECLIDSVNVMIGLES